MKRIRIVLADDHPIVLDGLEQLFATEGDLEVVARATSGEGALRALEEFRPDVLVLDLAMPGHDGLWVMQQAAARKLDTRIVLLTAHIDEASAQSVVLTSELEFDRSEFEMTWSPLHIASMTAHGTVKARFVRS